MDRGYDRVPLARSGHDQQLVVFLDRGNADVALFAPGSGVGRTRAGGGNIRGIRVCPRRGKRLALSLLAGVVVSAHASAGIESANTGGPQARRDIAGAARFGRRAPGINRIEMVGQFDRFYIFYIVYIQLGAVFADADYRGDRARFRLA